MFKKIIIFLIIFFIGFFTHAFFFPYLFIAGSNSSINNITALPKILSPQSDISPTPAKSNFITYVDFKNHHFNPSVVFIKKSYLLAITNRNKDQLMRIISDEPLFNSKRDYTESERIQAELNKIGTFYVVDRDNQDVKLMVNVVK